MKRRIVIPALAALAAVTALSGLGTPAQAQGILPTNSTTDPSGDVVGKSIDITKVAVTQTDTAYRVVVTYDDMKLSPSTRRLVDVTPAFSLPVRQSQQALLSSTTTYDFRTNPSGRTSVKMWNTPPIVGTPSVVPCTGLAATANYRLNRLYLTIPADCWPGSPAAVSSRSWKAPAGTWDGTSLALPEGAANDSTSSFLYTAPLG